MKKTAIILLIIWIITLTFALPAAHAAVTQPESTGAVQDSSRVLLKAAAEGASSSEGEEHSAPAAVAPDGEVAEDGINTNVATVWIIAVCAAAGGAILTLVIILAKRNKD